MRGAFWNIRGLNKTGRINCLSDFIMANKLDFVGIQETKKNDFQANVMNLIDKGMTWVSLPAKGTAGGILVGFKTLVFEVISWHLFEYCASVVVRNLIDNLTWRLVVVYGSSYEDKKLEFISELHGVLSLWEGSSLLGVISI
jgi:hypothetical protein